METPRYSSCVLIGLSSPRQRRVAIFGCEDRVAIFAGEDRFRY